MVNYLKTCIEAVNVASKIAKDNFRTGIERRTKDDMSFVTDIDVMAEQAMRKIIAEQFPNHQIIGEELGGNPDFDNYTWIFDPIDGTRNYAYGIPIYACGAALVKNNQIICSALALPSQNNLYFSELGKASFSGQSQLQIAKAVDLEKCLIATTRPKKFQKKFNNLISKLSYRAGEIRILGSGLSSIAFVGSGQVDAVVGYIPKHWDILPAIQIATQAGAVALDYHGNPWQIGNPQLVLAHPVIAQKIVGHLNTKGFNKRS